MKDKFLQIPVPLRKKLLLCICGCGLSLAMTSMMILSGGAWKLIIPALCLFLICAESSFLLWERCVQEKYVTIKGICSEIERTSFRRRIKAIYVRQDDAIIRFVGVGAMKNLKVGDAVTVYVAESTAIYEMDGHMVVCNCMAMSIGGHGNEGRGDIVQAG